MPKKTGTFDQIAYIAKYNKEHVVYRRLSFNKTKEEEAILLEWLDSRPESTSSYLKRLIYEDMMKTK